MESEMNIMVVYREKTCIQYITEAYNTNKQENNVCTPLLAAANSPAVKKPSEKYNKVGLIRC